MNLDLFSTPGLPPLQNVVNAARPWLAYTSDPTVAYLNIFTPDAPNPFWMEYTHTAFQDDAEVLEINHRAQSHAEMCHRLERATVIYIPGGNTYLLSDRLHTLKIYTLLQAIIQAGKPYVGFSAGAVICGATILTSGDMNIVGTPHLIGLGWLPCAIAVHFNASIPARTDLWDENIADYQQFHNHPVLALEDNAHLQMRGITLTLERGTAWLYRPHTPRTALSLGDITL
jgi:peptidase E